jgi:hypothetical protein
LFKLPSVLYHGTISTYQSSLYTVDLTKSRADTDFGKGFYLTDDYDQARDGQRTKRESNRERQERKIPSLV